MAQNQRKRQKRAEERALSHAGRKGHFASGSGPSLCVPREIMALADQIQRHNTSRACNCVDCNRGRRMLAKGMPYQELTRRDGNTRAPQLNGAKYYAER